MERAEGGTSVAAGLVVGPGSSVGCSHLGLGVADRCSMEVGRMPAEFSLAPRALV